MIKRLDWDSNFFGFGIGEIILNKKDCLINAEKFDLLVVKSNEDFELNLDGFNNNFSETKIVFEKNLSSNQSDTTNIYSINEINYDRNELYQLSY